MGVYRNGLLLLETGRQTNMVTWTCKETDFFWYFYQRQTRQQGDINVLYRNGLLLFETDRQTNTTVTSWTVKKMACF